MRLECIFSLRRSQLFCYRSLGNHSLFLCLVSVAVIHVPQTFVSVIIVKWIQLKSLNRRETNRGEKMTGKLVLVKLVQRRRRREMQTQTGLVQGFNWIKDLGSRPAPGKRGKKKKKKSHEKKREEENSTSRQRELEEELQRRITSMTSSFRERISSNSSK